MNQRCLGQGLAGLSPRVGRRIKHQGIPFSWSFVIHVMDLAATVRRGRACEIYIQIWINYGQPGRRGD